MIIKALTIENFKGIREPIKVEFKPITLLFGPNSAGKSTIVQALHYARETFERNNVDPGRTLLGGAAIDFGGFQQLVHNHDLDRAIRLKFDLDIGKEDLPDYLSQYLNLVEIDEVEAVQRFAKSAWVEVVIKWVNLLNKPVVTSYEVGINGELFARIKTSDDTRQVYISYINTSHKIFNEDTGIDETDEKSYWAATIDNLLGGEIDSEKRLYVKQDSALPKWGQQIEGLSTGSLDADAYEEAALLSSRLITGPGEIVRNELRKYSYLGPLREVPARNYAPALSPDESRWATGIAAWDVLYTAGDQFIKETSDWLSQDNRLNSGYQIDMKKYKELDTSSSLWVSLTSKDLLFDDEEVIDEIKRLPEKRRLFLQDVKNGIEVFPQDIGVGIAQVLPVIIMALHSKSSIAAIEQPELHIHPAFQVALGDLFITQSKKKDICFLLETHSEHLLLRLLRRIRETHENDLPSEEASLSPDMIAIYYIEHLDQGMKCIRMEIDKSGEFSNRWPRGFFEERTKELF